MILNVPSLRQEENSLECGVVCLKMILDYYGVDNNYQDLFQEFEFYGEGVSSPQIGISLMKKGFDTNIITLNPLILSVNNRDNPLTKEELLSQFTQRKQNIASEQMKKSIGYLIEYLESGGSITPLMPSKSIITNELYNKRPLIALLTSNFLAGIVRFNFHFNVIVGIDDKYVYVNDPLSNEQGGKKTYSIEDYLFAIHSSAYGDIDNASLLLINNHKSQQDDNPTTIVDKFVEYGGLGNTI